MTMSLLVLDLLSESYNILSRYHCQIGQIHVYVSLFLKLTARHQVHTIYVEVEKIYFKIPVASKSIFFSQMCCSSSILLYRNAQFNTFKLFLLCQKSFEFLFYKQKHSLPCLQFICENYIHTYKISVTPTSQNFKGQYS